MDKLYPIEDLDSSKAYKKHYRVTNIFSTITFVSKNSVNFYSNTIDDFRGANLNEVNLSGAYIIKTKFCDTDLRWTKNIFETEGISAADFTGAKFDVGTKKLLAGINKTVNAVDGDI